MQKSLFLLHDVSMKKSAGDKSIMPFKTNQDEQSMHRLPTGLWSC